MLNFHRFIYKEQAMPGGMDLFGFIYSVIPVLGSALSVQELVFGGVVTVAVGVEVASSATSHAGKTFNFGFKGGGQPVKTHCWHLAHGQNHQGYKLYSGQIYISPK